MKTCLLGCLVVIVLLLGACGRSPNSQFYVLNPIAPQQKQAKAYNYLSIGLRDIHGPAYLSKPEVMIHCSAQEVNLEQFHRWVENLDKNTKRVIKANLITLLPGAAFVSEPWDFKLKPSYQLQIDILQFEVDSQGNSVLSANYLIYADSQLKRKGTLVYRRKASNVTVANLVASMNANLNQFSRDLAKVFARLGPLPDGRGSVGSGKMMRLKGHN